MDWWILAVFVLGAFSASLANAAVYAWAWNSRRVSPWQPTPESVEPRTWADRIPIAGWLRLRRDASVLGRGFWVRPMFVEFAFGVAMAALYYWKAIAHGFVGPQIGGTHVAGYDGVACFTLHFVLAWLMLVASLIDIDEKTIPDEVTVPGTLLALVLTAALPIGLLPNVEERAVAPELGVQAFDQQQRPLLGPLKLPLFVEPTHAAAPDDWPEALRGGQNQRSLAIGLGCYLLWCFALTTRIWRTRRGVAYGLAVLLRRVARDLQTRPLREILLGGVLAIACVWFTDGDAWVGLLSSLVGLAVGGGIVWAVRIIGTLALRREAMGFGDVTLMMMIGAFLGWQASLMVFFLAPFAGLFVGVGQMLLRRDDVIPYGPFLCLGACLVVVRWGNLWPGGEGLFALGGVVPVVLIICLVLLGGMLWGWRLIKERLLGLGEDYE